MSLSCTAPEPRLSCDVLVIGGGFAALTAAIAAAEQGAQVLIISKGRAGRSGASAMTGTVTAAGYAVALGEQDSWLKHAQDTYSGGCGINRRPLPEVLCNQAAAGMEFLRELGVPFECLPTGEIRQYATPGHSESRTCLAHDNIAARLRRRAEQCQVRFINLSMSTAPVHERSGAKRLRLLHLEEEAIALALVVGRSGVAGAVVATRPKDELLLVRSRAIVLATGGLGRLFSRTSNPSGLTGDGFTLAFEAGSTLVDMEFVQFYPFRLLGTPMRGRLIIEASTFYYGAQLLNRNGERFMGHYDPQRWEATTRDIAARAISQEVREGRGIDGGVLLDLSKVSADDLERLNPDLIAHLRSTDFDPFVRQMRVCPEMHFFMGGVQIGEDASTTVPRLFVAGEAAGGVHGANRLGNNAFTEAIVFGRLAGENAARVAREGDQPELDLDELEARLFGHGQGSELSDAVEQALTIEVPRLMSESVGLIRTYEELSGAVQRIEELEAEAARSLQGWQDFSLHRPIHLQVQAARFVCLAAFARRESRGAHFRQDYPRQDDINWRGNLEIRKGSTGQPEVVFVPSSVATVGGITI